MRTEIHFKFKKSIFFILFFCVASEIYSQNDTTRTVPKMWVSIDRSIERRDMFKYEILNNGTFSKKHILNFISNQDHPLFYRYDTTTFNSLISMMENEVGKKFKGLLIYIAAYTPSSPPSFQMKKIFDKQIILIFAPTEKLDAQDYGHYYIICPDDSKPHSITIDNKNAWTNYYTKEVIKGPYRFETTLENGATENKIGNQSFDTKSIYYEYDSVKEFIVDERRYQDTFLANIFKQPKIDSIEIVLASYPDTGIGQNYWGYDNSQFKNRLHLLFEYSRKGQVYYIDQAPYFFRRKRRTTTLTDKTGKKITVELLKGGDNGQLCPPNCPHP